MKEHKRNLLYTDAIVQIKRWKIVKATYAKGTNRIAFEVYHDCPPSTKYQRGLSEWHFANGRKCRTCRRRLPKQIKELVTDLRRLHS